MPWRLQFVLLSATWGASFLFIKVLDERWPALWVAFGRIALGAATLLALSALRRERLPSAPKAWLHLAVAAVLFNALPFSLFAFAEKQVPSVLAGLWNATTPLWVLGIALAAFPEEQPTRRKTFGLAAGFAGAVLVLGPWRGIAGGALLGELACAGAAASYGVAFLYTRRHLSSRGESGIALSTAQLVCATAILALALPFSPAPTLHIGLKEVGSLLALGALGTGIAYVFNYAIVRAAGAAVASTVTYLIPVFATLLGVAVLGEPLRWNEPAGAAILLCGIAISQGRIRIGAFDESGSRARSPRRARRPRDMAG